MARPPRPGSSRGGGDDASGFGAGVTGNPGGGRSGSGQSWGTGGLNFDTKGIDEFTTAMRAAATAVKDFWEPFQDTRKAKTATDDFINHFKTQLKELQKETEALGLPGGGGGGGGGSRGSRNGGNSTMSALNRPATKMGRFFHGRDISEEGTGFSAAFRGARGENQPFLTAAWTGVRSGASQVGGAGLIAAGGAMAASYVNRNMPPAEQLQSAANTVAYSQTGRDWSTKYRDEIARNLGQQGWGFQGRADIAQAATTAQRFGIDVTNGQGGMSNAMRQAGVMAGMTGTTAATQMGVQATMRGPQFVNYTRMLGIKVQAGGAPQQQTQTYRQLRDYIFGPTLRTGQKLTKEMVQWTLRTPGTQSYALVQQLFGGDSDAVESFTTWVEQSAAQGSDITTQAQAAKAPGAQTTANVRARSAEKGEQRRAATDAQLLDSQEQLAGLTGKLNDAFKELINTVPGLKQAIGYGGGYAGGAANVGHGQGGVLGSIEKYGLDYLLAKNILGGGKGGGGGGGGMIKAGLGLGKRWGSKLAGKVGDIFSRGGSTATETVGEAAGGAENWAAAMEAGGEAGSATLGALAAPLVPVAAGLEIWGSLKAGQKVNKQVDENVRRRVATMSDGDLKAEYATQLATGGKGDSITKIFAGELRRRGINPDSIPKQMVTASNAGEYGIGDAYSSWGIGDANADPAGAVVKLRGPGKTDGMNADFAKRLGQMFADNPKLSLTSGFRTRADQERVYRERPGYAAKPGSSLHEKGLAADIGPKSEEKWMAENAAKYGLWLPMPQKEPWHLQPTGITSGAVQSADTTAAVEPPPTGWGITAGSGSAAGVAVGGSMGGPSFGSEISLGQGKDVPLGSAPGLMLGAGPKAAAVAGAVGNVGSGTGGGGVKQAAVSVGNESQQEIMATILRVGKAMGADPQMLLAAFETGWAESTMTNLHKGDKDSQGVFQQRPSQGWGTVDQVTNVEYAATSFFKRAAGSKFRGKGTAARMAQDVQRSAFSDGSNYQKQRDQAVNSLKGLGMDVGDIGDPVGSDGGSVNLNVRGGGGSVTIQNATFVAQIARGTPEEAESFARQVMDILSNRTRLLAIAGGRP